MTVAPKKPLPAFFVVLQALLRMQGGPCSSMVSATVVKEYEWTIAAKTNVSPDCQNTQSLRRYTVLAEDTLNDVPFAFPGPLIEADEGDTIRVTVHNELMSTAASIHYHGIHQIGTVWVSTSLTVDDGRKFLLLMSFQFQTSFSHCSV
jgi:hypothetical protein